MRLRLNTTLRAALIAAITAVGFTVTQTQAGTTSTTLTTTFGNCNQGTATNVTTTNAFGNTDLSTIPTSSVTGLVNSSGGTLGLQTGGSVGPVADFLTPNSNVGNGDPWSMSMSYSNAGDVQSISGMTLSVGLYNAGGSWQGSGANWKGDVTFTATVTANGTSTQYVGYLFGGDSPNPADGTTYYGRGDGKFAVTLTGSTLDLSNVSEYTVTLALTETLTGGTFVGLQNIGYNVVATLPEISTYTWHGTVGSKWSDSVWNSSEAFVANNNAVFDSTASCTTVIIDSAVAAKNVTVDGAEYTFYLDGGNLTSNQLIVSGDGASLALTGTGSVTAGAASIADGASLVVGTDATLKVTSGQKELMTGTKVTNNGTFVLTSNVSLGNGESTQMGGTLAIQGATVTLGTGEGTTASMESFSHVNLDGGQITVNAQNATINGVSVAAGKAGTVKVEDMKNSPNTVTLAGITQVDGTLNLTNNWNSSFTIERLAGSGTLSQPAGGQQEMLLTINSLEGFTGNLSLKHNKDNDAININTGTTAVSFNSLDLDIGNHSANFTLGAATNIGQMTLSNGSALFTGEHMLTVGGVTGAGSLSVAGDLTFDGSGASAFTGTLTVGGQIVKQGTGSQAISGTALHHTLDVQAGTLVLNGNFAIDDIAESDTTISYVDATGAASTSGFQKASGTLTVYSDHSSAGTLDMTNGHFTYGANDVTEAVQQGNGVFTLSGEVDYTTLYVNENTQALAVYQKAATDQGSALAGVVMKDATTLTVDADYSGSISVASGKGNVNISEGKTLTGTKSNITLAGAGTYVLTSGALGDGTTLGDNWTGTVQIVNFNAGGSQQNFNNLVRTNSTLELKGFTGWTDTWSGTISQNIKLTDNGDAAAWSNGSFSSQGQPEATFSGKWSGTGTFKRTSGNNMHYKYTGDISAWEGKFLLDSGNTRLTFADSATAVNAEIAKNGGTLNVVVDNYAVFSKAVTADSLTVNASKSAAFNGTATFGSVTQASGAAITVGTTGNLTLNGGSLTSAITNSGSVTLANVTLGNAFIQQGGDIAYYGLDGEITLDANYYIGESDAYVQVVNGGASSGSVTWQEREYELGSNGRIIVEKGEVDFSTFHVNDGTVKVSDIDNSKHGTTAVEVAGGILNVDQSTQLAVTVTEEGTITGDKADAKQVNIASGAKAYYTGGVEDSGVKFTPSELLDGAVEVDNYGQTQKYSIASSDLSVAAAALEMTGTEDVTVSNYVVVNELVNTTGKVLTLDNVDALMLTDMSITNSTVQVYTNLAKDTEATVAIAGILQGGGATLKADLTLFGGSTLDVDGGAAKALTLGSMLTIDTTSGLVNLDDDTLVALNSMNIGDTLNLIVAADKTTLEYGEPGYNGMWYDDMFNRSGIQGVSLLGDFQVYAQGDAFGLTKVNKVPEPTTGTLSLLALAALAARRRRK